MSGVLQSLLNPLEMKDSLPSSVAVRRNFAALDVLDETYWDADVQYFLNDIVFSPINDGAYIMIGGSSGPTVASSFRGGNDPSTEPDWWAPLTQFGSQTSGGALQTVTATPGTAGAIVLTGAGSSLAAARDSTAYLVTVQGTVTGAANPMTTASYLKWTVTASGTAAISGLYTVVPDTTSASMGFSFSVIVKTGTTTPPAVASITLGVSADAVAPAVLSACTATYMPLI